ncbi:MAG: Fur family transcriptional regulator [Alkalispirochaetaceae bacterium]
MVEKKLRKSKQRDRILEVLRQTRAHPTANWVYDQLKGEFPSLSLGNVYRNLNILVEQGLVERLDFGSTFDRYEAKIKPHVHFVCESCGAIYDIEIPEDLEEHLLQHVREQTDFEVVRQRIEVFGYCPDCRAREGW